MSRVGDTKSNTETASSESLRTDAIRAEKPAAVQSRWQMPWAVLIACVVVLAGECLVLYPHVASWFSQKEQSRVIGQTHEQLTTPPGNDEEYLRSQLALAHEYNSALASGAAVEANTNTPTGKGKTTNADLAYRDMLRIGDSDTMGRLRYDKLDIDLPIYHGTSDDVLEKGVGHLEGTSLPVGGKGTRSVLTAHRGLPESTLFTHLDRAKKGDIFTVAVLDQVLSYRVVETQTVLPEETEKIVAESDRDLMTLVTCTPLGINTHRFLVTGERIYPTPEGEKDAAGEQPDLPGFPWWAVILGGTVLLLGLYVWRSGYPPKPKNSGSAG